MRRYFNRKWVTAIGLLGMTCALSLGAYAQEWTRFRGPNGSGESSTDSLPAEWTDKDYNWRVALPGIGHGSPVLWGDKLFLTSAEQKGTRRLLLCLDAHDGHVIWQKPFSAITHELHLQNSFASSTPTVDERRVYVAWATPVEYLVAALDHDGHPEWQRNLGPFTGQHGFGTSPIIYKDLLVIGNDQDGESSLVALERETGKIRWRVPRRTGVVAYSTPCVFQAGDGPVELVFASKAHGLTGINPDTGSTNWELDVFDQRTVGSPLVVGPLVLSSCGSGGGARNLLVAVKPGPKPEIVYKVDRSAPYVPTSVANGDIVFLWGDNGVVTCIEAASGKKIWQKRVGGTFSGSPVRAGSRLYCISVDGEVVVIAASREYELLGRNALGELSRSTPAIAGGRIYLRTESHLVSIGGN